MTTHRDEATVRVGYEPTLIGTQDNKLVVTIGSLRGARVWFVDPAAPSDPTVLGSLPLPGPQDGVFHGLAVTADHLIRLWQGRVGAFALN